MNFRNSLFISAIAIFSILSHIGAAQDLSAPLPVDPTVRIGKLANGISYYIRYNKKPEQRAELRLVVNAGSVLENDDQRGLAHLVEHMAFNGTENFRKQELVNYLESIGMRFGPEINAGTGFDETVYRLEVPTDSASIVEKAFDILEDWAHQVRFDDEEIDKERSVVIEEWRLGRGAEARMRDKQYPVLFKGSRYADRLPIGERSILESFAHENLRRFYRDWYRPDLMAVVAVGDFDTSRIAALIEKHFSGLPNPSSERARTTYPVPDHEETLYALASDPEATSSRVSVTYKHDVKTRGTRRDFRRDLVEGLYNGMLNDRLYEVSKQSDPPFLAGFSQNRRFVRSKEFYTLGAIVQNNQIPRGLEKLLLEARRVVTHGFILPELEREKKSILRSMEQAFKERDKTESADFASQYAQSYLEGDPIPGVAYEYDLYKQLLPGITLSEVNALASELITNRNRVVMVNIPEKKDVRMPTRDQLAALLDSVNRAHVQPYVEETPAQGLVPHPPEPATIVHRDEVKDLGITEWKLSNGIRVILKPTDFKNDEVLFTSYSRGGTSLATDKEYTSAFVATSLIQESGVGAFDQISLQKFLAGKIVQVSPAIGELEEGVSGAASPADLETMFQLIYLYFSEPRLDSTAFQSYRTRLKGFLQNRNARPEAAFEDSLLVTMAQHHPRRRPMSEALLDEVDLQTSFEFYRDRFADASDFTFLIVGNFRPEAIEPLVRIYLGGLPALHRGEKWRDIGIEAPKGKIEKMVRKGLEPKSQVRLLFTGPFAWSREHRYEINSLVSLLRIKLREALREEMGGTYGVRVSVSTVRYPKPEYRITIGFGCAPERVEELTRAAVQQIDSVKEVEPPASIVAKVKEMQRREWETSLKENGFWLNTLQFYYSNDEDPTLILKYNQLVERLSGGIIQEAARRYFDMNNYVKATLYPADGK